MTSTDPAKQPQQSPEEVFAERFATWAQLHRVQGSGRSYPYAWRLPDLARPLGRAPRHKAQHALALDLYTLGRFDEALAALPETGDGMDIEHLRHRLSLLLGHTEGDQALASDMAITEARYCAYLLNRPQDWPDSDTIEVGEMEQLWSTVLRTWSLARGGHDPSMAASHQALARLRLLHPTLAAQAAAVLAETIYCMGPRWAPVWLDHALDQVDLFSQHHLKARLLGLKARALEAAGELGEGARFRKQAKALAERQGARLYLGLFIDTP